MISVIESIERRRSIRKYKPDPVPDEVLVQLLNMARLAPSSHNCQLARFAIVKDAGMKKRLLEHAYDQTFIESAPCIIVCCADLSVFTRENDPVRLEELDQASGMPAAGGGESNLRRFYGTGELNTAIAMEHIVLAATAFGLGTCWVRKIEPEKIRTLLGLPETTIVVALLPIGYPAQDPPLRPRLPLSNFILGGVP